MTFRIPVVQVVKPEHKPMQLFSLYQKTGRGVYERIATTSFTHELAMRVWGYRVLTNPLLSIRPIKIESDRVEGTTHFPRVHYRRPRNRQFGVSNQ